MYILINHNSSNITEGKLNMNKIYKTTFGLLDWSYTFL